MPELAMIEEVGEEEPQGFDLLASVDSVNLVPDLDPLEVQRIGDKVVTEYQIDCQSLEAAGWDKNYEAAMKMALQVKEAKNYPWPGAANVKYPLIATAAIQFNARAYPAIVDGWNVVKGKVMGRPTPEKMERAQRIGQHMSYQLLEEMDGWEEDTDKLLLMLPIVGTVFRKTYFDPVKGYNCSHMVPADLLVADYWTKDLDSCPRITQVCEYHPNQIIEKFRSGLWTTIQLSQTSSDDDEAPHTFLEQHRLLDLDGDGYFEPYIVTVHEETGRVVRIVARFDVDGVKVGDNGEIIRIDPVRYYTKYSFIPSPDGAFYDVGFGMLLNALNDTINSTINQLMDAGHLSNVQGGFLGSGISMKSGNATFKPGEWRRVETQGSSLKDSIVPLPVREPSSVLFNLLGMLIESAKDITATKDILTGEQPANTPVGTTLALIEQGLKVFTSIYKRIHRSLKQELALLARLNRLYLDDQAYFAFQDVEGAVGRQDYEQKDVDVIPVSDPTVVSDMQRLGRAQFIGQFLGNPLMDQKAIITRELEAAGIPDIPALFAKQETNPEAAMQMMKLELEKRQADLKDRELDIKAMEAEATVAEKEANARKTTLETELLAPGTFEQLQAMIDQAVDNAMHEASEPMAQEEQEHPEGEEPPEMQEQEAPADDGQGKIPGMEGPPADGGVPELSEGPTSPVDEPMGLGGGDGAEVSGEGPPDGGIIEPGMG